ncbi:MAG: helicase C-terminal domain-containing protein [Candidatus Paceibacterota bacterium]|nr:MAG: helicase C-terminal domain-containing protein [Candidatus Paceibacterota bacterium]
MTTETRKRGALNLERLAGNFPSRFSRMRVAQEEALKFVAENGSSIVEAPTGSGKTAIEIAILRAGQEVGMETLFLIVPNKTILGQIREEFPGDVKVALGRNEHPCLYYEEKKTEITVEGVRLLSDDPESIKADEIPCSMLLDCPHRVDQETGETHTKGAFPCPYLQQKYEAKQGGIVLCTMSFYLFTQLFSREWERPNILVIDEAHRIAEVFRNALSYEISDHHIEKAVGILKLIGAGEESTALELFLKKMIRIIKGKSRGKLPLLEPEELYTLIETLSLIDTKELGKKVSGAVKEGKLNAKADRTTLRKLEVLIRDLKRYIRSFEFSMPASNRHALNYTYATWREEKQKGQKVQYQLVIKAYYVAPLIKKVMGDTTVSFSATIGDPDVFGFETGIRDPFVSLGGHFPANNTRIFMPSDTPNLAMNARSNQEPTRVLRRIAKACKRFSQKGIRSLVVVVSNAERDKFLMLAEEEDVYAISYGNGVTARDAAQLFKGGEGDVLVGTASNYAEGVDLPKNLAPVIFVLRPGYPNPKDPGTIFEEKRFGSQRWQIWNWRVMLQALQARGRNLRSVNDIGVTIFISQQFRRFVFASLPESLKESYVRDKTFDECVNSTLEHLNRVL